MLTNLKTCCPKCQSVVKVSEEHVHKRVRCPSCKAPFEVSTFEVAIASSIEVTPATIETMEIAGADTSVVADEPCNGGINPVPSSSRGPCVSVAIVGKIGRFELREVLGQGAFGRVYRANDPQLDREVALKVPNFGPDETHKVRRFIAEAKAAARLRHPNIVPTYESGQVDGRYYIASQFVCGRTLSQVIEENPPDFRQSAEWLRQLADALSYAHNEGIVHRDIKPSNVMIDAKGVPQIMDFGLAKRLNEDAALTTDGSVIGTPSYMSPEQARGDLARVGPASDQHSLGVVMYELLTGRKAFDGPLHAVISQVIANEPPTLTSIRKTIPHDLEAICQKAMSKRPEDRYATSSDFASDLARWLGDFETLAAPRGALDRAWRWCRNNSTVASAAAIIATVILSAFIAVSVALWQVTLARQLADRNAVIADQNRRAADQSLLDARKQKALADSNASLARKSESEALDAKRDAFAKAAELQSALTKLKAETEARTSAEVSRKELEQSTVLLRQETGKLATDNVYAFYADRIAKADTLLSDGKMLEAQSTLNECPPDNRGWEWRYLMARARRSRGTTFRGPLPVVLKHLAFSPDGVWVLGGASHQSIVQRGFLNDRGIKPKAYSNPEAKTSWNGLWSLRDAEFTAFPIKALSNFGGNVCSFSNDGSQILTIHNRPTTPSATPHVWKTNDLDTVPQQLSAIPGFALDCFQNSAGEWLVLTAEAKQGGDASYKYTRLYLPLAVYNTTTMRATPITTGTGVVVCASVSPDREHVHAITATNSRDGRQVYSWYYGSLGETLAQGQLRLADKDPIGTSRYRSYYSDMVVNSYPPAQMHVGRHWGTCTQLSDGFDNVLFRGGIRSDLCRIAGRSASFFDEQGTRFFVVSSSRGIEIYDPTSPFATQPLLVVPIVDEGARSQNDLACAMAFDVSGDQIAVAVNQTITFLDASGGRGPGH